MTSRVLAIVISALLVGTIWAQSTRPHWPRPTEARDLELERRFGVDGGLEIRWRPDGAVPPLGELFERVKRVPADVAKQLNVPADAVGVRIGMTGDHAATVYLHAISEKPTSDELLDALVERIRLAVRDSTEAHLMADRAQLQSQERDTALRIDAADGRIQKLNAELRARTGRVEVSPATLQAAMAKLDDERQMLELDIAGLSARHDALQRTIAELTDKQKVMVEKDAVAVELEKVVAAREQELKHVQEMYKRGVAAQGEVRTGEAVLAEAKAKFALRRIEASMTAGGETASALNRELLTLSIDLRTKEVRLMAARKQLDAFQGATPMLDDIERLKQARLSEQQARDRIAAQMEELHKRGRLMPAVIVP